MKPDESEDQDETSAPAEAVLPEIVEEDKVTRLEEEAARLRDQWLRAVADTENLRKRMQREQEDTAKYAITSFARDMVHVLENLKRAAESVHAASENESLKPVAEGIDLTLDELLGIFKRHGINRVDPLNQKFDHNFHQAVAQAERNDVPAGTVVQVVQAGYVIHDRLLKPAMVVVSKAPDVQKPVDTTA